MVESIPWGGVLKEEKVGFYGGLGAIIVIVVVQRGSNGGWLRSLVNLHDHKERLVVWFSASNDIM